MKTATIPNPNAWSPDGRHFLYEAAAPKSRLDLWALPLPAGGSGDSKPVAYLQTPFNERQAQFSPDGRWVAYASDESGSQFQIFVQSFPAGTGKFQISTGTSGMQPRWRRDGKELFYVDASGRLMAVEVRTAPKFEAGVPRALFGARAQSPGGATAQFRYNVAADGKRFLVITSQGRAGDSAPEPITVVLNWRAAVRK